jgi:hypothetical protein
LLWLLLLPWLRGALDAGKEGDTEVMVSSVGQPTGSCSVRIKQAIIIVCYRDRDSLMMIESRNQPKRQNRSRKASARDFIAR